MGVDLEGLSIHQSEEVLRSDTNYCQRSVSSSPHALLFIHKEEDKSHAEEKADEMVQHGSWNYAFHLRTGGKTGPRWWREDWSWGGRQERNFVYPSKRGSFDTACYEPTGPQICHLERMLRRMGGIWTVSINWYHDYPPYQRIWLIPLPQPRMFQPLVMLRAL